MKPARQPLSENGSAFKTGIPASAGSQHLVDLIEWFLAFGFDYAAAEQKAVLWMAGDYER